MAQRAVVLRLFRTDLRILGYPTELESLSLSRIMVRSKPRFVSIHVE